jgi:hypothetical protein
MSGDYIVISPIPQNMVLRYEKRMALLWTTRRVTPPPAAPTVSPPANIAQRMATVQPAPVQPAASAPPDAVKLANVTALYSDKLTDGRE